MIMWVYIYIYIYIYIYVRCFDVRLIFKISNYEYLFTKFIAKDILAY